MALVHPQIKKDDQDTEILTKHDSKLSGERCNKFGFREYDLSRGCNQRLSGIMEIDTADRSSNQLKENIKMEATFDVNNFQMPPLADDPKPAPSVKSSSKGTTMVGPPKVDVEHCETGYIVDANRSYETGSKFYGVIKVSNGWEARLCGLTIGIYDSEYMAADRIDYELDKLQVNDRYRNRSECDEILDEMRQEDGNRYWLQMIKKQRDYWLACVGNDDSRFQPLVSETLSSKYNSPDASSFDRVSPTTQLPELSMTNRASATHVLPIVKNNTPSTVEFSIMGDDTSDDTCYDPSEDYEPPLKKKKKKKRKLFGTIGDTANAKRARGSKVGGSEESARKRGRCWSGIKTIQDEKIKSKSLISNNTKICKSNAVIQVSSSCKKKVLKTGTMRPKKSRTKRKRSSKYYGVCRFKRGVTCKWLAKCGHKYIGYFVMEDEAASAVDKYLDILGIDKRFRNLGSSKAALEMMSSGRSSRRWKRTYAAKVQAGEVEDLPVMPDEKPLSLLELKSYNHDLEGLGVPLEELDEDDEPEIREVSKEDRDSFKAGSKIHTFEPNKKNNSQKDNHNVVIKSERIHCSAESFLDTIAPEHNSVLGVHKVISDSRVEGGLLVKKEARLNNIAKKKELLEIMNRTGCRRGVKTEQPSLDRILKHDFKHLEVDLRKRNIIPAPPQSISLPGVFSASQVTTSTAVVKLDRTKIEHQQYSEQGRSSLIKSDCMFHSQSERLPQLRVKSEHARSPAGQCVQTMLLWRAKQLLSVSEYLTGLRMLEGRYGEIIALSSRGLLNMGDIDTFKASMEELEEHPK